MCIYIYIEREREREREREAYAYQNMERCAYVYIYIYIHIYLCILLLSVIMCTRCSLLSPDTARFLRSYVGCEEGGLPATVVPCVFRVHVP